MHIHLGGTTSELYDAIQCGEIPGKEVIVSSEEGVVGISDTYPVAVTAECGELHTIVPGYNKTYLAEHGLQEAADAAIATAKRLGLPLADWVNAL